MTTEEWLQRVYKADQNVYDLEFERMRALNSLCGSAIDTGSERVQTSQTNATEDKMIAYVDYAEKINQAIDDFIYIRDEVERAINKVESYTYRELLRMRYLEFKEWGYIENKLQFPPESGRKYRKYCALKAVAPYCV